MREKIVPPITVIMLLIAAALALSAIASALVVSPKALMAFAVAALAAAGLFYWACNRPVADCPYPDADVFSEITLEDEEPAFEDGSEVLDDSDLHFETEEEAEETDRLVRQLRRG